MSKSEKRYFTLDAQKAGRKNAKYLELFRAISKMEAYDDSLLDEKFKKYLAVDKSYLYEAILKSMRDYHSKKSLSAQIKEMLIDAKYLFERELFDLCEDRLNQAKKLAESLSDHLSLLMIAKEERRLVHKRKGKAFEQNIETVKSASQQMRFALKEEYDFLDAYDKLWINFKQFPHLKEEEQLQFEHDIYSLNPNNDQYLSPISQWRHLRSLGLIHQMQQSEDKTFGFYKQALKWWDENPCYKEEEFYIYTEDITNFLVTCIRNEKFDEFERLILKVEQENPSSTHYQKLLFEKILQLKLFFLINRGITDTAEETATTVEKGLSRFEINPSKEKVLVTNTAILFFLAEKFDQCLLWCDKLLRWRNNIRMDNNRGIHFLKLVALFELEDIDKFENTVRSLTRFLKKEKHQAYDQFIGLLKFLKLLPEKEFDGFESHLNQMINYIEKWAESSNALNLEGIDEMIILWAMSQLERTSIATILRREFVS